MSTKGNPMTEPTELDAARERLGRIADGGYLVSVYSGDPNFDVALRSDLRALVTAWNTRPSVVEPVAWLIQDGDGTWVATTRADMAERWGSKMNPVQPLYTRPSVVELEPDWAVSKDGPIKIGDQRRWLARKLMDSKLTDEEAFGIVCYHPNISDLWKARPRPSVVPDRGAVARAIADGLSAGCEQYDEATDAQRFRYDMAADAVLSLLAAQEG